MATANKSAYCEALGFEFLNPNAKTVMVFNKAITAFEVKECIRHCIDKEYWQKDSNIIILCGHHTTSEGKLGANFHAFQGMIANHLEKLKEENEAVRNSFNFSYVSMDTFPVGRDSKGDMAYQMAPSLLDNLKKEFKYALRSEEQNVLVFATCFSKKSEINCVIDACGLYPALFLSAERGLVSQARRFKLDKQQRDILEAFSYVRSISCLKLKWVLIIFQPNIFLIFQKKVQNLILHGSSGTGKTLMLIEVLRLKAGQFKAVNKPFKIILASYVDYATNLLKDIKNNFGIRNLLEEFGAKVATMDDLAKGSISLKGEQSDIIGRFQIYL